MAQFYYLKDDDGEEKDIFSDEELCDLSILGYDFDVYVKYKKDGTISVLSNKTHKLVNTLIPYGEDLSWDKVEGKWRLKDVVGELHDCKQ